MGKVVHYFPELPSTNTKARELLQQEANCPEGTVVICSKQTQGRGQRGTFWEGQADQNLTLSFILKHKLPHERFWMGAATALGLREMASKMHQGPWMVKWPNDLYYADYKIGGILVEAAFKGNQLEGVVVGLGLNVNQAHFQAAHARSIAHLLGSKLDLVHVYKETLIEIERFLLLMRQDLARLRRKYTQHLYRQGEEHSFESPEGHQFKGTILGVTKEGLLALSKHGKIQHYDLKEIRFL